MARSRSTAASIAGCRLHCGRVSFRRSCVRSPACLMRTTETCCLSVMLRTSSRPLRRKTTTRKRKTTTILGDRGGVGGVAVMRQPAMRQRVVIGGGGHWGQRDLKGRLDVWRRMSSCKGGRCQESARRCCLLAMSERYRLMRERRAVSGPQSETAPAVALDWRRRCQRGGGGVLASQLSQVV